MEMTLLASQQRSGKPHDTALVDCRVASVNMLVRASTNRRTAAEAMRAARCPLHPYHPLSRRHYEHTRFTSFTPAHVFSTFGTMFRSHPALRQDRVFFLKYQPSESVAARYSIPCPALCLCLHTETVLLRIVILFFSWFQARFDMSCICDAPCQATPFLVVADVAPCRKTT